MARVICQALLHPQRLTLRWSEADKYFEPYHLEGEALHQFRHAVRNAQERLRQLALTGDAGEAEQNRAGFALAQTGHQLFQQLFPSDGRFVDRAAEIKSWLQRLYEAGDVDSLEIVGDTVGVVPWNVVYEEAPQEADFSNAKPYSDCWRKFWGIRYDLTVTHQVNSLRSVELLQQPDVLLVVDSHLRHDLPAEAQTQWKSFFESQKVRYVESADALADALAEAIPDVLYLFCRVDVDGIQLGASHLIAADLKELLTDSDAAQVPWNNLLVILNAVGSDPMNRVTTNWDDIKKQFYELRLGGLIVPEYPLPADRANHFGIDLLEGFLFIADTLGGLVQNKRSAQAPLGLVYSAACPSRLQVSWEEESTGSREQGIGNRGQETENEKQANPTPYSLSPTPYSLPAEPYFPLLPFDHDDRALLAAREDDIAAVAELVDAPQSRLILVHGRPGVGKRSLLRAGVIPLLDRETAGYHALRDRTMVEEETLSEKDYPVVPLRTTTDLSGQLALALCAFAAEPLAYTTPTGRTVSVDLPGLLRQQLDGDNGAADSSHIVGQTFLSATKAEAADKNVCPTDAEDGDVEPVELRDALMDDEKLLARLLRAFGEHLPWELVLLVEHGEELFSLSRTGADVRHRQQALALLCSFANAPGHAKIIVSLRTEYAGRFSARVQQGLSDRLRLAEYLLPALSVNQMVQAIVQPTLDEPLPFSSEIPLEKYRFTFEEGLPRHIAQEALRASNEGNEEALPLVQIVCFLLYLQLEGRADRTITEADLKEVGGVQGGIGRYLQRAWAAVVRPTDRRRMYALLQPLCWVQPDGLMTRDLLSEADFTHQWRGRTPPEDLVRAAASSDLQLMEETVTITERGEESFFSLGHDAYVPPLVEMGEKEQLRKTGRGRVIDTLFIVIPAMLVLASLAYVFLYRPMSATIAAQQDNLKEADEVFRELDPVLKAAAGSRWPQYIGQIHRAHVAWQADNILQLQQTLWDAKQNLEPDTRSFEWYYLWQLAHGERQTLAGHRGEITALALSADGKYLASAAADDLIHLWGVAEEHMFAQLKVDPGTANAAAFSPDGKTLAWNSGKTIVLIDLEEKGEAREIVGHDDDVTALVFADDKTLISASADKTIKLWDTAKNKEIAVFNEHGAPLRALASAPKEKKLASVDTENKVILWDLDKKEKLHALKGNNEPIHALAFTPDGTKLAVAGAHDKDGLTFGLVKFWDAAKGEETGKSIETPAPVLAAAFTPDGETIITGDKANHIRLWNVEDGKETGVLKGHVGSVRSLAITPNGDTLISGSVDGTIKLWDLPQPPSVIQAADDWILALALSPDNKQAASGGRDGTIKIFDLATGKETKTLKEHKGPVTALAYAKNDDKVLLASGSRGNGKDAGKLLLWDVAEGKVWKELNEHKHGVTTLALTGDGKTLVSAGLDGTVLVWDVDQGEVKTKLTGHEDIIRAVVLGPDGNLLVYGGDDGVIHLWDLAKDRRLGKGLTGHVGPVYSLALHLSGHYLASAGADRTIKLWDVAEQKEFDAFLGHTGDIYALEFSPIGESIVSASGDGTLKLWYAVRNRGLPSFTFTEHTGPVRAIAFSSNRRILISAGHDGTIRIRRAAPMEMKMHE